MNPEKRIAKVADSRPSPLEVCAAGAIALLVASCAATLPERHKRLLTLRYEQEWTFLRIAAEFGVSEVAVCRMHGRVLRRLRGELRARGVKSLVEVL